MAEKSKDRKIHRPTKESLIRFGAAVSAAAAFAAPAAEAKSFQSAAGTTANSYLLDKAHSSAADKIPGNYNPSGMKAAREGTEVLREMLMNIRPDVSSSAVLRLGPGTFLAYGPHKGSPGEFVAPGMERMMTFPQLAMVDGRLVARGLLNDGTTDDQTLNSMSSRWVEVNSKSVVFYYMRMMDPAKGYPLVIPVHAGAGNNLASNTDRFKVPPLMQLAHLSTDFHKGYPAEYGQYLGVSANPGPKPRPLDIFKAQL